MPEFLWVLRALGKLMVTLAGVHHALKCSKYAVHHLAAFGYRFNRCLDLRGLVARLIVDVAQCAPVKDALIRRPAAAGF